MALWGGLLGGSFAAGVLLIASRLATLRRPQLAERVLPYVRDLRPLGRSQPTRLAQTSSPVSAATGVFGPLLRSGANTLGKVLGGEVSIRRRLQRAGVDKTVHDFRVEQLVWGLIGFAGASALGVLIALNDPSGAARWLLLSLVAFAMGVILRDNHLTTQAKTRERLILQEFPALAELLALAVAAGEGPVPALDRVVGRSRGELSRDLAGVLAEIRTGASVGAAFDQLAATTGLPVVARFAHGVAVAVERGTPLAEVLHAQAADVREAGRRELIEIAAGKEVVMMAPVVFLVLPVTVLFAFWPGVIGLSLFVP